MEQSIETIWKEGFLNEKLLIAPKVNDLYNRKSIMIVDRLCRMFDINNICLIIGAIAVAIILPLFEMPIIGFSVAIMLICLLIPARGYRKTIKEIDACTDCYHYLLEFQKWNSNKMKVYTKIHKIFYPVLFLVFMAEIYFSEPGQHFMMKSISNNPDLMTIFMVPYPIVIGIVIITGILYMAGGALYRLDAKIVLGREFARLNDTLKEMKALQD